MGGGASTSSGKYVGQLLRGTVRHGRGSCAMPDGSYYEGDWYMGAMQGSGLLRDRDGSMYEGMFEAGKKCGWGRTVRPNNDEHVGEYKNGLMDGFGKYMYCNGSLYLGQFMGGTANGLGVFVNAEGERYVGEWAGDKFHGNGIYKFLGGSTYAGSWKFGKMDGHGVYTNVQGSKYLGKYEGQFLNGCMDGSGVYLWAEGDVYVGEYSADKRHGCGMYTSRTGAIYKGEYNEGKREGWGEYMNSNLDKYEGPFVGNERHGNGVVTLAASEESDPVRMKAAQKWGALWFKDVDKDPLNADAPLEIDPTRVFVGNYEAGVMVSRRPYEYEDWENIQIHCNVCTDNVALVVVQAHKCVMVARKSLQQAEEAGAEAEQLVASEQEDKLPYFVKVKKESELPLLEDRLFLRFGPRVSECIFFACFPAHRLEYITEDEGVMWALPYSSATRTAQFQGSQGDEINDIVKEMEALPKTSKLRQWLAMVLRRQGHLTLGDGQRSSGVVPVASPRPSDDPSAIRIQTPRSPRKLDAVSLLKPSVVPYSDNAASNVALKSLKTVRNPVGSNPAFKSTSRREGQDVDPKILQMAAHAASLRPPTTKSEISAGDVGLSVLRGVASSSVDSTTIHSPDEGQREKKKPQPPLPPHALPPPHAHRKPNVRDFKNEGV